MIEEFGEYNTNPDKLVGYTEITGQLVLDIIWVKDLGKKRDTAQMDIIQIHHNQ